MRPEDRLLLRNKVSVRHGAPANDAGLADRLAAKLGYLLNQCAAAIRIETARALERHSINPREAGVLICLLERSPIVQQDLAEQANIDRTTAMNVVAKFVDAGLVERSPHPRDRRAWVLSLTARGKKTASSVERIVDRVEDEFLRTYSAGEREGLRSALCDLLSEHRARTRTRS